MHVFMTHKRVAVYPDQPISSTMATVQTDELVFFVNGKQVKEPHPDPDVTLLAYLRDTLNLRGSKQACGIGGCGACTVMVSWFAREENKTVNKAATACLVPVCGMHGCAVTTVEGVGSIHTGLHPIQARLVENHGIQCGFCTPGMVMSMYALLRTNPKPTRSEIENALDGNLCRCTGYSSILQSVDTFSQEFTCGLGDKCCKAVKGKVETIETDMHPTQDYQPYDPSQEPIFPSQLQVSDELDRQNLRFEGVSTTWLRPTTLEEFLVLRAANPNAIIVGGFTHTGLQVKPSPGVRRILLTVSGLREAYVVQETSSGITLGAALTINDAVSALQQACDKCTDSSSRGLTAVRHLLKCFASQQIRNMATLGGSLQANYANSDVITAFVGINASIVTLSSSGQKEVVSLLDLCRSGKYGPLENGGILLAVNIPFTQENEHVFTYKQSSRRAMDRAIVNAGLSVTLQGSTRNVQRATLCFGGVADTIILAPKTAARIVGQTWEDELLESASIDLNDELASLGVNNKKQYRLSLALAFFFKFYEAVNRELQGSVTDRSSCSVDPSRLSTQVWEEIPPEQPQSDAVGCPYPNVAARQMATGEALYYSDLPKREGSLLATTTHGSDQDVEMAVAAAKAAYTSWSSASPHVRARHLYSLARHLQKHQHLLVMLATLENGKPFCESRDTDIPTMIRHVYHYAGWAQLKDSEMVNWKSVGVVVAMVPSNFPLLLLTWKVCPALAMGNTVVLTPASDTSLSALLFAEICAEAGLPPGVFNVVTGNNAMRSQLADHPDVDMVAFTGSTKVGRTLRQVTAGTGKKILLGLGGKSPVIVFESADLDSTVAGVVDAIWFNQGQVHGVGSRLLVQEAIFDKFIDKLKVRMGKLRVGPALDKVVDMGALVSESQLTLVRDYVERARAQGAEVYQEVAEFPTNTRGFFYPPTLITKAQTSSPVVMEEVFGPVLVALPFRTAKEAVALVNNSIYGLAASVWTESVSLALEVALLLKVDTVWVNAHNLFDAAASLGGYRQSGYGRDGGKEGLYEYMRPCWEQRHHPEVDYNLFWKFGATFSRPAIDVSSKMATIDIGTALPIVDRTYKLYYGGAQKRPDGQHSRAVRGADGAVVGFVGESNRKDVRNAVEAAHKAAPGWGKRAAHNRAQILYYLAENLEVRLSEFASQLSLLTGCSDQSARHEVTASIDRLFHWAAYSDKYGGTVQETTLYGLTVKVHEPMGVIGIACPDESPLLSFVSLLAPAIVRGNCVVVIPSERYPLPALDFYQVLDTSDVPAGVVNILSGDRDHVTKHLADHQDVQAMWYFGSPEGAKYVEYASVCNMKRTLVSYGKSRDWTDAEQGAGEELLYYATQIKNIWMPMGDIFAN